MPRKVALSMLVLFKAFIILLISSGTLTPTNDNLSPATPPPLLTALAIYVFFPATSFLFTFVLFTFQSEEYINIHPCSRAQYCSQMAAAICGCIFHFIPGQMTCIVCHAYRGAPRQQRLNELRPRLKCVRQHGRGFPACRLIVGPI